MTHVEPLCDGRIDVGHLLEAVRPNTRLIVITQASNVTGCIQPVEDIAKTAAALDIPFLIDASQSAGAVDLNHEQMPGRVFVAAAGHKGLFGPTGTGFLVVPGRRTSAMDRWRDGRTEREPVASRGVAHPLRSRHDEPSGHCRPEGGASVSREPKAWRSWDAIDTSWVQAARCRLAEIPGCRLSPLAGDDGRAGIVSFTLDGWSPEEVGFVLESSFDVETRTGLHCAPMIHRSLGTLPEGSVRVSVARFNTQTDIEQLDEALATMGATCTR